MQGDSGSLVRIHVDPDHMSDMFERVRPEQGPTDSGLLLETMSTDERSEGLPGKEEERGRESRLFDDLSDLLERIQSK